MTDRDAVAAIRAMVAEAPNSSWVVDPPLLAEVIATLDALADMVRVGNEKLLAISALCDWWDDKETEYELVPIHRVREILDRGAEGRPSSPRGTRIDPQQDQA